MNARVPLHIAMSLVVIVVFGCDTHVVSRVCEPGTTQPCACTNGSTSEQTCAVDGKRWEPCECSGGDGDADADGDVDGDSDVDIAPGTVDMLFVIDNSNSMEEEQGVLAEQVVVMLLGLLDPPGPSVPLVTDLHLGIVTTDMGTGGFAIQTCAEPLRGDDGVLQNVGRLPSCLESYGAADCDRAECPWLAHSEEVPDVGDEPDDPPIWEDFGCIATLGTGGCGFEQQLEASYVALVEQTRPGRPNEGFLRDDSLLVVVYVTDEDDCSASDPAIFDPSRDELGTLNVRCALQPQLLHPIERYYDAFVDLRNGDQNAVVVAAIVGIPIDGSWDPGDPIERLRDLQQVNPSNPNELLTSCSSALGSAYPPVRIVELVYAFGNNGVLASICQPDWTTALQAISVKIRDALNPDL